MSVAYASSGPQFGASEKLHARIIGIDVFRFFAIVGVVFIHASDKTTLGNAFDLSSRFSVPFFFIVAGYFAGLRPDLSFSRTLRSVAKRIILPYLVWLSLYVVYSGYDLWQLTSIRNLASLLIYAGPGWHLWFLPSLAFGTLMLSIVGRSGELRSLVGLWPSRSISRASPSAPMHALSSPCPISASTLVTACSSGSRSWCWVTGWGARGGMAGHFQRVRCSISAGSC